MTDVTPPPPHPPQDHEPAPVAVTRPFNTRTIMTSAALGVAFGIVLIPVMMYNLAVTATLPVLAAAGYGVWGMAALVPIALQRRFGVGILASTVAGFVAGPVSGYGWAMGLMMLVWGLLMELPFIVTRFRRFSVWMFVIAGLIIGVLSAAFSYVPLGMEEMALGAVLFICASSVVSSVVCAVLSYVIARGLSKAGIGESGRRSRTARIQG